MPYGPLEADRHGLAGVSGVKGDSIVRLPQVKLEETQPGLTTGTPRTLWSTVLTATPILLTVLATILAGLSSRELTLSQYHRALAAQNQSKAGDQWNLFQAKRSRRTNHENTVDLLLVRAGSGTVDAVTVERSAAFFLQRLRRADSETSALLQRLATAKEELGAGSGQALHQAAMGLQQTVREKLKQADLSQPRIQEVLSKPEVRAAWIYLNHNGHLPMPIQQPAAPWIEKARQAIAARRPEEESAAVFRHIPDDELRNAMAIAEANVQAVERAYEPVSEALEQVEKIVQGQTGLVRSLEHAVHDVEVAVADLPGGTGPSVAGINAAVAALSRSAQTMKSVSEELSTDFTAARHAYQARRYKDEADFSGQAAETYEIEVRKSSALSERHRDRSKNFFFGMLAAQAGVTIATFSLAVKHKSILWTLASLTGIAAVLFALYVHVYI
jgi:hypothetical protein